MQSKHKVAIILLALLIVGGIAYAGMRLIPGLGGVKLAEGYLYEAEEALVYAKTTKISEQEVEVELTVLAEGIKGGVPVLESASAAYPATFNEEGQLLLQLDESEGQLAAVVTEEELLFSEPLTDVLPQDAKLVATALAEFQSKQEAFATRIEQAAEAKREEQAREKARVEKAQKVEKVARLKADLLENIQYLEDLDFSAELGTDKENLAILQSLLDEVNAYAAEATLLRAEYEAMAATVESMKVLRDGVGALADSIEQKKKNIENLISILEADMADLTATWEEIADEIPDADKQLQELNEVKDKTTQAIAQAKERMAASDSEQTNSRQQAEGLYQQAITVVNQTKEKHGF
jgi:chromosome segregation ATPase